MRIPASQWLVRLAIGAAISTAFPASAEVPDGSIWLEHVSRDLLPYWTMPDAQGKPAGRFPTFRCNDGTLFNAAKPCPELASPPAWIKAESGREYVRMQSRQVFAYAMAFHLTGNVELLKLAQAGARDIHERALDRESGSFASWYEDGKPMPAVGLRTSQDLSYAGVGLAALYYLTRDPQVLDDLVRLKNHVFNTYRDPATGMIKWVAKDDGSGESARQELVALLDQLNAYLILVTPALPEGAMKQEWKKDISSLSESIVAHFYDEKSGFFFGTRGAPDSETPRGRHNDFGHTVKSFWMLYLGARMNGDARLAAFARDGMRRVTDKAYLGATGSWASRLREGGRLDEGKEWWIYAELDQAEATLAVEEGDKAAAERLEKTWRFWLDHQVDHRAGEVWGWVAPDGKAPADGLKQHHWKNGFHSLEHAVVSYLAAQALNGKPATLYFALQENTLKAGNPQPRPYTFDGTIKASSTRRVSGVAVQQVNFELKAGK